MSNQLRASQPEFADFLSSLDLERFHAFVGHRDNATHFKSSGNLHWWSQQKETLGFIRTIWIEFGCPGKGKGPWDGVGAVVKTKVRNDITNLIPQKRNTTASGRITCALDVAQHLRAVFASGECAQSPSLSLQACPLSTHACAPSVPARTRP